MSASLSRRLSVSFWSTPDQGPKAAKFAVLIPDPGMFVNVRNAPRVVIAPPTETPPVLPFVPSCAILLAKASVYPPQSLETNVAAFVPEVLKTVWTMCWKRWYDCVSYAFHGFSEDEKESRIKGWRLNRRSARSPLPPPRGGGGGVSAGGVVASFARDFRAAGVLVLVNAGVPRILVVPCGRFGRKSR